MADYTGEQRNPSGGTGSYDNTETNTPHNYQNWESAPTSTTTTTGISLECGLILEGTLVE